MRRKPSIERQPGCGIAAYRKTDRCSPTKLSFGRSPILSKFTKFSWRHRTDIRESGLSIKGRLDVPGTVRLRLAGNPGALSLSRDKTLVNPISAAVVVAHAEVSRWLGSRRDSEWMPERVKDLMPHLIGAVGSRPRLTTRAELDRVRLTPITAGFRPLAELSVLIAGRRGVLGNPSDEGTCTGFLLDVAELWELYVLAVLRRTWPGLEIAHGTRGPAARALLKNGRGESLGLLKPDAVIRHGGKVAAVADAKYKRLCPSGWNSPPQRRTCINWLRISADTETPATRYRGHWSIHSIRRIQPLHPRRPATLCFWTRGTRCGLSCCPMTSTKRFVR
jgi:hypothetical protein